MPGRVHDPFGNSVDDPSPAQLREFLDRIDPHDEEHGAAWVESDAGWNLEVNGSAANGSGVMVFEKGDEGDPVHLAGVSTQRALDLWLMLLEGRLDELQTQPWQPGLRPPMPANERAKLIADRDKRQRAADRKFYDGLGPERPEEPCRAEGCRRGAIHYSVFCRSHHFEEMYKRPCPFDD
jgi:hypothetical protein